jgi:hypothetical protein
MEAIEALKHDYVMVANTLNVVEDVDKEPEGPSLGGGIASVDKQVPVRIH